MKKFVIMTLAIIVLIMISCKITKNQTSPQEVNSDTGNQAITVAPVQTQAEGPILSSSTPEQKPENETAPEPVLEPPANPVQNTPRGPVTQYDSNKLDEEVRKEAKIFNADPNTYRRLLRKESDGTKIYRMIGMHIIQNPNGEEAFLPDEL